MPYPNDHTKENGKANIIQIIQLLAQFLLLPLCWMIYQMYVDINTMKVQLARLEGRIESNQLATDLALRGAADKVRLESELEHLRGIVNQHREKSTYDKLGK
jgi:hypothetical protein